VAYKLGIFFSFYRVGRLSGYDARAFKVLIMRLRYALSLSCLLISAVAWPSLAGSTSVTNSYQFRSIFNGKSSTEIDIKEIYTGWRSAESSAVKEGWTSTDISEYKNGRYFNERDRFDIKTSSYSRERGDFANKTDIKIRESYDFTGFNKSHEVVSSYDF
jgi:hypothetical protein